MPGDVSEKLANLEAPMEPGTKIRTTDRVWSPKGFLPPDTAGTVVIADSENTFLIEFADVEIETGTGEVEKITTRASVLVGYFREVSGA